MARSRWLDRTARLVCETCNHSSLIELGGQSWPVRLICGAMKETRIRARCSRCGASKARLYLTGSDSRLVQLAVRLSGPPQDVSTAELVLKE